MFRAPSLWSPINQILAVEQYGPPRFLGSPLAPLPCSKRPRPRLSCHASSAKRCCPRKTDHEGHSNSTISRLIHTASVLAVYASSFGFPYTGKTRFRWVANPYRVGFEPTGLRWRISSTIFTDYPNAPDFAWRHCLLSSNFYPPTVVYPTRKYPRTSAWSIHRIRRFLRGWPESSLPS